jgi:hypothetical protein
MPVRVLHKKTNIESQVDVQDWNRNWIKSNYQVLEITDVGNLYFHEYVNYTGTFMGMYEKSVYESFPSRCSYCYSFEELEDVRNV